MYFLSQSQIFILFFILGLVIGTIFDIFRVLRKAIKTSNFMTSIEDIIFTLIIGILIINSLIVLNNGELRFYIVLAIFLGCSLYFLTISKIFFKFFYFIANFLEKIVKLFYNIYIRIKK